MEMTREIAQDWHAKDRAAALADWCAGAIGLGEYEDAIQQADLELEWRLKHCERAVQPGDMPYEQAERAAEMYQAE